jgi:MFS superfamily sulfate permease-like transporter
LYRQPAVQLSLTATMTPSSSSTAPSMSNAGSMLGRCDEVTTGIVIVRLDAPLFFANGGLFDGFVRSVVERSPDVRFVILAAEPITEIDTTAIDELVDLDDFLTARGIDLLIAEMKGPVQDQIQRYGLVSRFGAERFMPTVGAEVDAVIGTFRGDLVTPDR